MHTIISAEQLRTLLNDSRQTMGQQPWIQAIDDHSQTIKIPHGKMEALQRLDRNEWVFIPVVRTQKKGGKLIEHGFEIHRREAGLEVVTAALEVEGDKPAKVHAERARNHAVQQELEKLRLRAGKPAGARPAATQSS
jgi:DNA-directed RNA polymerase subunit H (RpoH/RPB5)